MMGRMIDYITFTGENVKDVVSFCVNARHKDFECSRYKYDLDTELLWIDFNNDGRPSIDSLLIHKGYTVVHCILGDKLNWLDVLHGPCAATVIEAIKNNQQGDAEAPKEPSSRNDILKAALDRVSQKSTSYGAPEDNHKKLAQKGAFHARKLFD